MADETTDDDRSERDTDRPVAGGDAYSAETVMRDVPPDVLKKAREDLLAHLASEPDRDSEPPEKQSESAEDETQSAASDETSEETREEPEEASEDQGEALGAQETKADKPLEPTTEAAPEEPAETKVEAAPARHRPASAPPAVPMSKLPTGQLVLLALAIAAIVGVLVYAARVG